MDRYSMIVALGGQVCGTVFLISLVWLWVSRRKTAALPRDMVQRIDLRLSEMQQSLDAVAIEVERISEGQRFTTKLLAERGISAADEVSSAREVVGRGPAR